MSKKLITYSIMMTQINNEAQIQEIANDIERQYKEGISNLAIFFVRINPDSKPIKDKITYYLNNYLKVKKELDKRGLKSGILVQSTLGHGAVKCEQPFEEYKNFTNGLGAGIACPLDKDFQQYVYDCYVKIAKCGPSAILLDDDFRLIYRPGKGCACKNHMERFNKAVNGNFTREELYNKVTSNDEDSEYYASKFIEVEYETLNEFARLIRSAIDSVDPSIQGVLCSGGDNSVDIAKIVAGKNNPTIIRIGNANYSYNSTSGFTYNMFRAAKQVVEFKGIDYLLAETDTTPHHRYSKTAKQFNSHYIASILEGVKGAKHWITRLSHSDEIEWESGEAYRKMLAKNAGLYQTLANLVDGITWHGFKIPIPKYKKVTFKKEITSDINSFAEKCFERLGLPMYFSAEKGGITCFTDNNDIFFTDEELKQELSCKAIISSDVAKKLQDRGFSNYLGVKVEDYLNDLKPTAEKIYVTGKHVELQVKYKTLKKLNDRVKVTSELYYNDFEKGFIDLGIGTAEYENEFGGKVAVFCGTPNGESTYIQGYSFLNYARKRQFIEMLKWFNEPLIYYKGDENVYLKTGTLKDGKNLTSIINLCYDEIENFSLVYPTKPQKVSFIDGDGSIKEIPLTYENGEIKTGLTLYCLDALILIIE